MYKWSAFLTWKCSKMFNTYNGMYRKNIFFQLNLYQLCDYFPKSHTNAPNRPYVMQYDKNYIGLPCKSESHLVSIVCQKLPLECASSNLNYLNSIQWPGPNAVVCTESVYHFCQTGPDLELNWACCRPERSNFTGTKSSSTGPPQHRLKNAWWGDHHFKCRVSG